MKSVFVVRDCLSEEILLARPLLSSSQGDLTALLKEVKELLKELKVPVKGVISDGQDTIGSAVALRLPRGASSTLSVPRALWMPTSPSTKPIGMPKQSGSKHVRGVRPLERALEERSGPEAEAIRGDFLAVRSSLTDDGRPPLDASGLKLQERLTQISDSIARVEQKKVSRPH